MIDYRGEDLQIGGTSRYLYLLASRVRQNGYDVRVAMPISPRTDHLHQALLRAEVQVDEVDISPESGSLVRRLWNAYKYLSSQRPHLVHFILPWWNSCEYGIWGAWLARISIRIVSYAAMPPPNDDLCVYAGVTGFIRHQKHRLVRRLVSHSFAVSEAVRNQLVLSGFHPHEKTSVARCGVALEPFADSSEDKCCWRKEWGVEESHVLITMVGYLEEIKGHSYILQALPDILRRHSNVRVAFVGDGHLRKSLESHVLGSNLSKHVIFTGWQQDVPRILNASDILVLPSLSEGMPFVVLEAMAAGLPVVATRVGGIPEAVVDGETGVLVEPRSASALYKAIVYLIDHTDYAVEMGMAGRARIKTMFSVDQMINDTCEVYSRALVDPSPKANAGFNSNVI